MQKLPSIDDGVYVHGVYMDGFRWDDKKFMIEDSLPGKMSAVMPVMQMVPQMDFEPDEKDYRSPMYKTSARAGVLSTTGRCFKQHQPINLFCTQSVKFLTSTKQTVLSINGQCFDINQSNSFAHNR